MSKAVLIGRSDSFAAHAQWAKFTNVRQRLSMTLIVVFSAKLLCSDEGSIHKWRYWFRHRTPAQVDAQVRTQVDAQVETQVDQRWYTSEAQVVALVETLSKSL